MLTQRKATSSEGEAAPAARADMAVDQTASDQMALDQTVAKAKALSEMEDGAERAAEFLKALSNRHRLIVLCLLAEQERTVGELETLLMIRQPTLSQQLARLRAESLVETRRDGKRIYYRLASDETRKMIELLYGMFCGPEAQSRSG